MTLVTSVWSVTLVQVSLVRDTARSLVRDTTTHCSLVRDSATFLGGTGPYPPPPLAFAQMPSVDKGIGGISHFRDFRRDEIFALPSDFKPPPPTLSLPHMPSSSKPPKTPLSTCRPQTSKKWHRRALTIVGLSCAASIVDVLSEQARPPAWHVAPMLMASPLPAHAAG